jgi:hypothetical protein
VQTVYLTIPSSKISIFLLIYFPFHKAKQKITNIREAEFVIWSANLAAMNQEVNMSHQTQNKESERRSQRYVQYRAKT